MRIFRYRKALLLSMLTGLLLSGVAVASTATAAPAAGAAPSCYGIETNLLPRTPHGGAIRGEGGIECEAASDIGIEVTLTEDGRDVAQRRLRCVPATRCETAVKTSFEAGKRYCVRVFVAVQSFPAKPGVAPEPDLATFCERHDGSGDPIESVLS